MGGRGSRATATPCRHHWRLTGLNPISDAVCIKCGAPRTFVPQSLLGQPIHNGAEADAALYHAPVTHLVNQARRSSDLDIWIARSALEGRQLLW